MGLVSIGAAAIDHGDPVYSWRSSPDSHGIRAASIGGSASWAAAKTLGELVANPTGRQTVGGFTGVLEYIVFDDSLLSDLTGYYLLQDFTISAGQQDSLTTTDVPFTLSAAYLGPLAP